jgi:glycosyltransferase involved in cell wall biosynthesis
MVRSRNPKELADGITTLLGDEGLRRRLAATALARARNDFSLDRSVEQYGRLYQELTTASKMGQTVDTPGAIAR